MSAKLIPRYSLEYLNLTKNLVSIVQYIQYYPSIVQYIQYHPLNNVIHHIACFYLPFETIVNFTLDSDVCVLVLNESKNGHTDLALLVG